MNIYNKFNDFRKEKLFTDVTITLIDNNDKIDLDLHKIVLVNNSAFFKEKLIKKYDKNKFNIKVPNVKIMKNIILSFYGEKSDKNNYPKWFNCLKTIECKKMLYMPLSIPLDTHNDIAPEPYSGIISSHITDDIVSVQGSGSISSHITDDPIGDSECVPLGTHDDIVSVQGSGAIYSDNLSQSDRLSRKLRRNAQHPCSSSHIMDDNELYDLEIPDEGFNLLIYIIDHFLGYNNKNIKLINKYLPNNVDMSNIPINVIKNMINLSKYEKEIIITCDINGNIKFLDPINNELPTKIATCFKINSLHISYDNKFLVVSYKKNGICIFNIDYNKLEKINHIYHNENIITIFLSNKNNIMIFYISNNIIIWDINNNCIYDKININHQINSITMIKDDMYIIFVSYNYIYVYDIENKKYDKIIINNEKINQSYYLYDDILILCSDYDIYIWDIKQCNIIRKINAHKEKINKIILTLDKKFIISCSEDKTIKIWDIFNGNLVKIFYGHTDIIYSLDVISEKNIISVGKEIIIWDITTMDIKKIINTHIYLTDVKYIKYPNKVLEIIKNNLTMDQKRQLNHLLN